MGKREEEDGRKKEGDEERERETAQRSLLTLTIRLLLASLRRGKPKNAEFQGINFSFVVDVGKRRRSSEQLQGTNFSFVVESSYMSFLLCELIQCV